MPRGLSSLIDCLAVLNTTFRVLPAAITESLRSRLQSLAARIYCDPAFDASVDAAKCVLRSLFGSADFAPVKAQLGVLYANQVIQRGVDLSIADMETLILALRKVFFVLFLWIFFFS